MVAQKFRYGLFACDCSDSSLLSSYYNANLPVSLLSSSNSLLKNFSSFSHSPASASLAFLSFSLNHTFSALYLFSFDSMFSLLCVHFHLSAHTLFCKGVGWLRTESICLSLFLSLTSSFMNTSEGSGPRLSFDTRRAR